jgi:ribosome-associated protein
LIPFFGGRFSLAEVLKSNAFEVNAFESDQVFDHQADLARDALNRPGPALSDEEAQVMALTIAQAADDRKASDIRILKVGDVSYLADFFVIATGFTNVQVRAISRSIEDAVAERWGRHPLRSEGITEGRWVLQDYGEVIVHIFTPKEREFYDLEAFWGHAESIAFVPETPET